MLRNYDKIYQGSIDFSIAKTAVDSIKLFLEKHLADFPAFLKKEISLASINEDLITSKLEIYLQRQARQSDEIFMFQFQYPEAGSKRTLDMSVLYAAPFASTESIFAIEAKRLPTPGSGRQKEYVEGNLGAIERFKRNHHGKSLQQSAILGYIEGNDFNYWHQQVCGWIKDLISTNTDTTIEWNDKDLLDVKASSSDLSLYESVNTRIGSTVIYLSHYWFYVN